jgi:WD40 repeat protein
MADMVDRYEKRRLLSREVAGEKQVAFEDTVELKYQLCHLFKALSKQEKYKKLQGVCDDPSWLKQQFAELLHFPRYALIKTCPRGGEYFQFHPTIHEEKLYTTAFDDIRVTNCSDDSLITTLTGTDRVTCLAIDDGKLYCGGDGNIQIWNCSTDTLIKTLTEPNGTVDCLIIHDGKLYSGDSHGAILVWNCSNHAIIKILGLPDDDEEEFFDEGHFAGVLCLTINDNKLYSGSLDRRIKVWDCSTNQLITTLTEKYGIERLLIHGGKLYSKGFGTISVYDCSNDTIITTVKEDTHYVNCLEFHNGKLYTGGRDCMINVYDCSDDSLVTTLGPHAHHVIELTFQNGKLYSKQRDGAIYIWQL